MKFHVNDRSYTPSALVAELSDGSQEDWLKDIVQFVATWLDEGQKTILQKTSGSTGTPKELWIEKEQMRNSAHMTGRYFGANKMRKMLLCLPAHYIAGKMMIVRALVWGVDLYCVKAKSNPLGNLEESFDFTGMNFTNIDFTAMIPMQVNTILEDEQSTGRFQNIAKVLIGGGAVSPELLAQLQKLENACYASYGMTETVSHIAIRALNGAEATEWFYPMEEVKIDLDERGCLTIEAPKLNGELLVTNDLMEFNDKGGFRFLGRWDNVVNSGGVKLIVERIEAKLSPFIQENFYLKGVEDARLGEKLVLFVEGTPWLKSKETVFWTECKKAMEPYENPKEIVFVASFQRTTSGKIKRL